jgi:hypothetical protein
MNLRRAAATLALVLTPAALFAAEGTFDKTLNVSGTANLKVGTGAGYIHITPGPDGSIHIIGHVHANNWMGSSADSRVREVTDNPPIEQSGNSIGVGQHTHYQNISIDYVITAPRGTTVEAGSGSGDINISNLGAPLKAGTGSGTIEANDITGDVALSTGSGDIRAMMNGAHYVKAETGSGSIHLQGVTGGLYAETGSGDIEIGGQPGSDWKLHTGSGTVTLNTGGRAHFSLDASTGSGDVHSDPPIMTHGSLDRHHVTGDINGGGPIVRIETGSGDVRIH